MHWDVKTTASMPLVAATASGTKRKKRIDKNPFSHITERRGCVKIGTSSSYYLQF